MNEIEIKPETALIILEDRIRTTRDMWFRDALVLAVKAVRKEYGIGDISYDN